jgi:hypothetical protein
MDARQEDALRRIYQADDALRRSGRDRDTFLLIFTGTGPEVLHGGWDESWAKPTEHEIDDLEELGFVRILEVPHNKQRKFQITQAGREQASALLERLTQTSPSGGAAPSARAVLEWLVGLEASGVALNPARGLTERAVAAGLVGDAGRDAFAKRILQLIDEGPLAADVFTVDQTEGERELELVHDLRITMQGHQLAARQPAGATINMYGSVVNSQVAAGDISNTTTFVSILVAAQEEIDQLVGVDEDVKGEAKGLLARMGGVAGKVGSVVVSEAGAQLATSVLAQKLGIPLS